MMYFSIGLCLTVGLCNIFARYAFTFALFVCLICCKFYAIINLRLYQYGAG